VIAGDIGVSSMHDVTEGGILGAVWELCDGSNKGAIIKFESIPIHPVTKKICEHYKINPLRLISSGTMLMTASRENSKLLLEAFDKANIQASIIGEITEKDVYLEKRGRLTYVTPPDSDELYKVVN
jgi:hydrogenase expression/formation protein HypE